MDKLPTKEALKGLDQERERSPGKFIARTLKPRAETYALPEPTNTRRIRGWTHGANRPAPCHLLGHRLGRHRDRDPPPAVPLAHAHDLAHRGQLGSRIHGQSPGLGKGSKAYAGYAAGNRNMGKADRKCRCRPPADHPGKMRNREHDAPPWFVQLKKLFLAGQS